MLEDGTEFDSSAGRDDPISFKIGDGQVIKGWDQGLLSMCVGELRRIIIPPSLGYGSKGVAGRIPPNATIIFDTEMVKIEPREREL